ncbi:LysR family transcriptional regulator [Nocardioides mesophilus]|uniref:LysR family transcriptional regulator n=1 Tax=Nocardioides mesophilus TaxID=433659 RepID=A0A7G9RE82_9ACTN|nr:LysR family transcriptional regulator [Nocardioides mesophilus]QNN53907.1 LysR family transcriptional regulator [Nocardioides mesophilus]
MHESSGSPAVAPDLRGLAEFVAVARLEHVTHAAESLGIPQSTLSRRLARLEQAVGVPLLHRRGRGVRLTPTGEVLAAAADRALGEVARVLEQLTRDQDPQAGLVTLGFLHTLGPETVPRALERFGRSHPRVRFRLVQEGHDTVVAKLRAGEVDVCLTAPPPGGEDVETVPLEVQRLCLAVPREHPLAGRRRVRMPSLAGEAFIGFKPGYGMRQITDDWCRRAGFTPALAFEGDDMATVRGLVAAGLGVALLPSSAAQVPAGLVEVDVVAPSATRTLAMAWLREPALSAPAAAFRDFLRAEGPSLMAASTHSDA